MKISGTGILVTLLAIAVIVGGVYMYNGGQLGTAIGNSPQVQSSEEGGLTIVTTDPIIRIAGKDAQQRGTSVGADGQANTDGSGYTTITLGTTTAKVGQTIDLFLQNGTAYHNAVVKGIKVSSSTFPVEVKFNGNATVTENMYTTTGLVLSNSAGTANTQNQTDSGLGGSYNIKDEMSASALDSTQDMLCVIEVENGTALSSNPVGVSLSLDGNALPLVSQGKPVWYTSVSGSTLASYYVFSVPAQSTTATKTYYLGLVTKSDGRLSKGSSVIKSCYPKEYFVDTSTGEVTYDVADSLGTLQSLARYRYHFYFV